MKVGILSKGVSLLSTWNCHGPVDVTVAVNDAIGYVSRADWLCMTDMHKLHEKAPHLKAMFGMEPLTGIVTAECYVALAQKMFPYKQVIGSDSIIREGHANVANTFLLAIWFSQQYLKADEIDLYGCDLGGYSVVGMTEGERALRRWPEERRIISSVCEHLRGKGIKITSYGKFQP